MKEMKEHHEDEVEELGHKLVKVDCKKQDSQSIPEM